jgi:hypothetical protein
MHTLVHCIVHIYRTDLRLEMLDSDSFVVFNSSLNLDDSIGLLGSPIVIQKDSLELLLIDSFGIPPCLLSLSATIAFLDEVCISSMMACLYTRKGIAICLQIDNLL